MNYDKEEDNDTDEDVEEVQGAPEEEDSDVDVDEDEAQGPPLEENDAVAEPPAVEDNVDANNDDNDDNVVVETDAQQPVEVGQPGDLANQGNADDEDDEVDFPEIQGVDEEAINPETPGVGENREDKDEEEAIDKPPLVPPQRNDRGNGRYNLRNTWGRDYDHRYAGEDFVIDNAAMTTHGTSKVLETPQMTLKVGLRTFGNDGVRAVEKEMRQLHDRGVMMPVHKKSLTSEQRKEALAYLMFLKRKRCGKVKGHGCTDG